MWACQMAAMMGFCSAEWKVALSADLMVSLRAVQTEGEKAATMVSHSAAPTDDESAENLGCHLVGQ